MRCGRCQAVFNATEYLQDAPPSPQLDLPITAEATLSTFVEAPDEMPAETPIEIDAEPDPATHAEPADLSLFEALRAEAQGAEPQTTEWRYTEPLQTEPQVDGEPAEPDTLAQQITFADSPNAKPSEPVKKKNRAWPWIAGSLLLLILLLAQATYFFRIELAANHPGLKPALVSYCRLLQCTVPLPQNADLMSIESSDLEADPAQTSVIALNALLRNHAPYTQAYPALELTLTDAQDKPLARRTFRPAEYLKPGEDEKEGLAANRELSVKLNLDTTDLKPSGYRLFLFYPQ